MGMLNKMGKKAFGTYEIAGICHVSPSTVGNWVEKGLLPTFTTGGGHRRVWAHDLADFLNKHNIPIPEELRMLTSLQILIVDDEEQIRKMIRRIMQRSFPEAKIDDAADGFEAGQKVTQMVPNLIILDMKLPGMDGFKVCQLIRSYDHFKHTKILAISGHNVEEFRKQALRSGADDFLAKPFDADKLNEAVQKLIGDNGK